MTPGTPFNPAVELTRVAAALEWAINRDDWWGPARLAFDAEVGALRDTATTLATEAQAMP